MLHRCAALLLSAVVMLAAAPAAKIVAPKPASPKTAAPKTIAPDTIAHATALFLRSLSNDGKNRVQFRATAFGSYFFFEDPAGVTVYIYDGNAYTKVEFLKGSTLTKALKKYTTK
jgi:hypothetical protein